MHKFRNLGVGKRTHFTNSQVANRGRLSARGTSESCREPAAAAHLRGINFRGRPERENLKSGNSDFRHVNFCAKDHPRATADVCADVYPRAGHVKAAASPRQPHIGAESSSAAVRTAKI